MSIFYEIENGRSVPSTTLDEYLAAENIQPDLIKIDVEGAELKVLRGMTKTLQLDHLTLLIEVHPGILQKLGFESQEIIRCLKDNGFTVFEFANFRTSNANQKEIGVDYVFSKNSMIFAKKFKIGN